MNKTECELYAPIHLPFYRSLVFFHVSSYIYNPRVVHCSPIYTHSLSSFPLHTYLLLYTNVLSTVKAKSFFSQLFMFYSVCPSARYIFSPPYNILEPSEYLRFLLPSHPTLFFDSYLCSSSSILSCAFTLEMTGKPERSRWMTGLRETTEECVEWLGTNNEL